MNLVINVHEYSSIIIKNAPQKLAKYLKSEMGLFIGDLDEKNALENIDAILTFVPDSSIPTWSNCISLGVNGGYADLKQRLFWYVDKYGAPVCFNLNTLNEGPLQLLVSEDIVISNFVEIIIRGWLLRFSLISKRVSFVHASAVKYKGQGILFSAWGGTGKTNLVLSLLGKGASYMGDDLVLLTEAGEILAFPERINIFDYNVKNNRFLKGFVPPKSRFLFMVKDAIKKSYKVIGERLNNSSNIRAIFKRIVDFSYPLGAVPVSVEEIFPNNCSERQVTLTHGFLLFRSTGSEVSVREVTSVKEMATRMASCLHYEHVYCDSLYDSFLFAFPEFRQSDVENLFEMQVDILTKGCQGARLWYVEVPVTATSESLCKALEPFLPK